MSLRKLGALPLLLGLLAAVVLLAWGFSPAGGKVQALRGTIRAIGSGETPQSLAASSRDVVVQVELADHRLVKVSAKARALVKCRVGGAIAVIPVALNMGLTRWESPPLPCG